jgi:hypothetical protein
LTPLTLGSPESGSAGAIDQFSISLTAGKTYVFEYTGSDMVSIWMNSVSQGNGVLRSTGAWARITPRSGTTFIVQVSGWSATGSFNFIPTTQGYTLLARPWSFWSDWFNVAAGKFKSKRP